jgi:tetratricopeptide (TPR) repeat protein
MLIASTAAVAKERSALESASVKAATDCVAKAALNNPNITTLYREDRLNEVTDWIVLRSSACDSPDPARPILQAWANTVLTTYSDRSIAACSKLLTRSSSRVHAAAFHNRGVAFAAKGNLDQAVSDISQGIRLDPQRAYRWQERGVIYTRQGKYQQAIADITEAIRIDPTSRAFRFHTRAEAYRGLGDLMRAIADFDEAIRLDPVARSFRFYDRGNALREAGQYDRALVDYETALKLAPTNAWVLLERGRTYARMGRSQAAKGDFDTALNLDPSNEGLGRAIEVELSSTV